MLRGYKGISAALIVFVSGCGENKVSTSSKCLISGLGNKTIKAPNLPIPGILGGSRTVDPTDDRVSSTVLIRTNYQGASSICGGVFVAPGLVLTAAHCIKPNDGLVPTSVRIGFGVNRDTQKMVAPIKAVPHPRYPDPFLVDGIHTGDDKGNPVYTSLYDIAYLTFDPSQAPSTYKPIPVWTDTAKLRPKDTLYFSGWGATTDGSDPLPKDLLSVTSFLARVAGNLPTDPPHYGILVVGPNSGIGVCRGDSGGPGSIKAGGRLFALGLTQGFDPGFFPGIDRWACSTGAALFTSIAHHREWIESDSGIKLATQSDLGITTIDDQKPLEPEKPTSKGGKVEEDSGC